MTNNSFDSLYNTKNAKNDEESRWSFYENMETSSIKESQEFDTTAKVTKKEQDIEENVVEKGKGVTSFKSHITKEELKEIRSSKEGSGSRGKRANPVKDNDDYNSNDKNLLTTTEDPEAVVRDLEARNLRRLGRNKFSSQTREILTLTASLHIREGKGLTVGDLQKLGFEKNNAEGIIYRAMTSGLLIPGDERKGIQKQYYLSNYKHIIDKRARRKKGGHTNKDVLPSDKDIVLLLLRLLSNREYVYHNIHLETS